MKNPAAATTLATTAMPRNGGHPIRPHAATQRTADPRNPAGASTTICSATDRGPAVGAPPDAAYARQSRTSSDGAGAAQRARSEEVGDDDGRGAGLVGTTCDRP